MGFRGGNTVSAESVVQTCKNESRKRDAPRAGSAAGRHGPGRSSVGELPSRATGRPGRGAPGGKGRVETVKAGRARDRVLASRVRERSGEGPAGMKKPRAVSAGAADLLGRLRTTASGSPGPVPNRWAQFT